MGRYSCVTLWRKNRRCVYCGSDYLSSNKYNHIGTEYGFSYYCYDCGRHSQTVVYVLRRCIHCGTDYVRVYNNAYYCQKCITISNAVVWTG